MGLQMVHGHQRLGVDERDGLGGGEAHDHAADQAGAGGGRHAVEVREGDTGVGHRLGDDLVEPFDMGACGDLRHHAAECGVLVDLRQHHVGQNPSRPFAGTLDHRGCGLVAGGFDTENEHGGPEALRLRNGLATRVSEGR